LPPFVGWRQTRGYSFWFVGPWSGLVYGTHFSFCNRGTISSVQTSFWRKDACLGPCNEEELDKVVVQPNWRKSMFRIEIFHGNSPLTYRSTRVFSLFKCLEIHLKSVFFNSATAMLIFTILLDGFYRFFHTQKTDDLNDASTSFFHIFSLLLVFLRLLLHWVFLDLRHEWWVDEWTSLFLLHWVFLYLREEIFALFFFCSEFSKGHSIGFSTKRDLLERILWKLKFAAATFESLITFYHWKFFCRYWGLNPGLHSLSCPWCIYCKAALMQTWN